MGVSVSVSKSQSPSLKFSVVDSSNVETGNLRSELLAAINNEDISEIKALIEKGTNLNLPDPQNNATPLYLAAMKNNPEIVELLLKHGANPNFIETDGNTAIEMAIIMHTAYGVFPDMANNNLKIIQLFLEYGLDPHMPNKQGTTPYEFANHELRSFFNRFFNNKKFRELRSYEFTYLSVIPRDLISLIEKELNSL